MSSGASLRTSFRTASNSCGIVPSERISPFGSAMATVMDAAWTSRPTNRVPFMSDRLLSHVALRYALVTPSRSVIYGLRL